MSSVLEKSLAIIEILADHPMGLQVSDIAHRLNMPVSGVHRQLRELARLGYVQQQRDQGEYALTLRLAALGLGFLGRSGVHDISQPILDRLASLSGELVRLSILDGSGLTWVAVAQGATVGLKYDPGREQGQRVHPASTSGGQALLSTLTDDAILKIVGETGLHPQNMPKTSKSISSIAELMQIIATTRQRGYAVSVDTYINGMAAMAVPVRQHGATDGVVLGCLSIAGPAVRFPMERMVELAPSLFDAATELGRAAAASKYFTGLKRT
jgi:IclR family acetate operon transcriptional repressor